MIRLLSSISLAIALTSFSPNAHAADDLAKVMDSINSHFKYINAKVKDTTTFPTLADDALGIQDNTISAMAMVPDKITQMTDLAAARVAKNDYRSQLTSLLQNSIELEALLLKLNPAAADLQAINDHLASATQIMKTAHQKFR